MQISYLIVNQSRYPLSTLIQVSSGQVVKLFPHLSPYHSHCVINCFQFLSLQQWLIFFVTACTIGLLIFFLISIILFCNLLQPNLLLYPNHCILDTSVPYVRLSDSTCCVITSVTWWIVSSTFSFYISSSDQTIHWLHMKSSCLVFHLSMNSTGKHFKSTSRYVLSCFINSYPWISWIFQISLILLIILLHGNFFLWSWVEPLGAEGKTTRVASHRATLLVSDLCW